MIPFCGRIDQSATSLQIDTRNQAYIYWDSLGGVAQSGEHLLCKQGVRGSNPLTSTIHCSSNIP